MEHKFEKFSQMNAYSLKAQWLSGINLRLKIAEYNLGKFNHVIVR
ncbi:hypothetical protein ACWOA6_05265 [Globicatella sulfidifaciens]